MSGVGDDCSRRLTIPSNFPVQAAIGKRGARIKDVKCKTGAKICIKEKSGYIEIKGSSASVAAALALYEEQFKAGGGVHVTAHPHPHQVHMVLQASLSTACFFHPVVGTDEFAAATDTEAQLYTLRRGKRPSAPDHLSDTLSRLSLLSGPGKKDNTYWWRATEATQPIQKMAATMLQAQEFEPAFDHVELRFNLGRQFYYKAKSGKPLDLHGPLDLQRLKALKVGRDIKCVYSNSMPAAAIERLRAFITRSLGFRKVQSKSTTTAMMHLICRRDYTSVDVFFAMKPGGQLEVVKIKSGQEKLFFLTLSDGGNQPDARLKIIAQRDYSKDGDERARLVWDVASQCRITNGRISMPDRHCREFKAEWVRYTEGETYEGKVQIPGGQGECTVSLAINRVRDERPKTYWEVIGVCHELSAMHGHSNQLSMQSREAQAEGCIQAVKSFCRSVCQRM